MPPSSKHASAAKDRRKSSTATSAASAVGPLKEKHIVTLTVHPLKLRALLDPGSIKEDSPVKESNESPATSNTLVATANSNTENASDSTPDTPAAGTPAPQGAPMGPPADGPNKKKGVKRTAGQAANGNGEPKVRGKPGPKKKQRLDDGTVESGRAAGLSAHKLGPKANQGAINAGLRALDRSGKPCRKWARGGFTMKSFTGVIWEIPRWTAPPKPQPESLSATESTPASVAGSSKENNTNNNNMSSTNKEAAPSQVKSDTSGVDGDVEMQSAPSMAAVNSPAPLAMIAV